MSNVEVYWKISSSKMMGDQGWCMDDIRVWSNVRTKKCESHEDHDVYNQLEDKDDYVHLVFNVMTHKNCWQSRRSTLTRGEHGSISEAIIQGQEMLR